MKRSRLATLATRALIVLVAGVWAEEFYEGAADPKWLTPPLDNLLDSVTITLTLVLAVWLIHSHFARLHSQRAQLHERRLKAVFGSMASVCEQAGLPVPDHEASQPLPCVRHLSDRRGSA